MSSAIIKASLLSKGVTENKILKLDSKDYLSLLNTIKFIFKISEQDQNLNLSYKDSENDKIEINKQEDWNSALDYMSEQKEHNKSFIFRLIITLTDNQSYSVFDLQSEPDTISTLSAIQNNKIEYQSVSNPMQMSVNNYEIKFEIPNEQIESISQPNKQENMQEVKKEVNKQSSIYDVCGREIINNSNHSERSRDGNEKRSNSQRDQNNNPDIIEHKQDNHPNLESEENNLNEIGELARSRAESILTELNKLKDLEKIENEKRRRNIVERIKMNITNQIDANGVNNESKFISHNSFTINASKEVLNLQIIQNKIMNSLEININKSIERIKSALIEGILDNFKSELSSIIKSEVEKRGNFNFEGNFNQPKNFFPQQIQQLPQSNINQQPQMNVQFNELITPIIIVQQPKQNVVLPLKIPANQVRSIITIIPNFPIDFSYYTISIKSFKTKIQNCNAAQVSLNPSMDIVQAGTPCKIEFVLDQMETKFLEHLSGKYENDFRVDLVLVLLNKISNTVVCQVQPSVIEINFSFSQELYHEYIIKDIRQNWSLAGKEYSDSEILKAFIEANENKSLAISALNSAS